MDHVIVFAVLLCAGVLHLPTAFRTLGHTALPPEDRRYASPTRAKTVVALNLVLIMFSLMMLVLAVSALPSTPHAARRVLVQRSGRRLGQMRDLTPDAKAHGLAPIRLCVLYAAFSGTAVAGVIATALAWRIAPGNDPGVRPDWISQKKLAWRISLCAGFCIGVSIGSIAFLIF